MEQIRKTRAQDYLEYFGDMDLTETEKEERIQLAEDLDDVFFFLFALILLQMDTNADFDEDSLTSTTIRRYKDALIRFGYDLEKTNAYLNEYVGTSVPPVVQATLENLKDSYYLSDDRAKWIAENEANSVKNYVALKQAIKEGKTRKTWITKRDKYVRHTHTLVDNVEIGIYDAFEVGNSLMLYPKDVINGEAKECINCRCVLKFSGGNGKKTTTDSRQSSVDEMHIGTTDDSKTLHVGTTDDSSTLHIGTTDDSSTLHIGTVTDSLHVVRETKNIAEELEKENEAIKGITEGNLDALNEYTASELLMMFGLRGYKVDADTDGNYTVIIADDETLEYHNEDDPYYVFEDGDDVVIIEVKKK